MAEIFIYDDIGPDWMGLVSSAFVINELGKVGKGNPVTVRVNSPGGSVVEAQAIYNALRRHSDGGGTVTVEIDALAASAASYIAMAGDSIIMAENAMMMIHKSWTIAVGNADDMRSQAGVLDKFDGIIIDTYAARSNQTKEALEKMLADETWLTAQEAVDKGLADSVGQPLNVAACLKPGRFAKVPDALASNRSAASPREVQRQLRINHTQQQLRIARARV